MLTKFNLYQPAAIDNSLNSYQIIHKIIHEMNLIIDEVNNIDSKANEYTDEQIRLLKAELQVKFDNIENEIVLLNDRVDLTNSNLNALENAFNNFKTAITTSVNQLSINVANLSDYVAQTESMLINYIDNKIDVLTHLIETLKGVKVFSLYGRKTSIQKALDDIYKVINPHTDITINELFKIITDGYTFFGSSTKMFGNITFNSILNCSIADSYYLGGDFTESNYYFCKLIIRTDFNNFIKTPFYDFLYLLIQASIYQWSSEAQSQIPVMITNIWRWFYSSIGYPNWNNAIYLNSGYGNYNNDTQI